MSDTLAGLVQLVTLLIALGIAWKFLGDWMYRVFSSTTHGRVEKLVYRGIGVDPDSEQRWSVYARSALAFSAVSLLALYGLLRLQSALPLSLGRAPIAPDQAFNTAASFVSNTNWQSYSGEQAMGHLAQMAGLAVQNFLSAAVGIAVAIAVVRGITRAKTDRLGNFWVDLIRASLRILLPIAVIATIILIANGVVQNLRGETGFTTVSGGVQHVPGGPIASQEAIKELGTNGGGPYNANSAHPFENPNGFTNLLQIFLILLIPVALTRTFGKLVGSVKQGLAVLAAITVLFGLALGGVWAAEAHHSGAAGQLAGAAMEGKETRFGIPSSALFATATTDTSSGAVNSFHDSYTPSGGGVTLLNMLLGEVTPGGVGSGLYGIVVIAILAVFLSGLMVGRTPEYLRKKITQREIKLVALYVLITPAVVLTGTALALAMPSTRASILAGNGGAHGLSEVMYAFGSAANNNGSAFGGLSANTGFYNTALAVAMLIGRFIPMVLVLALAGSLSKQKRVPEGPGTLPTHKPLFVVLLVATILLVAALTYVPALALGPIAEGLS